MNRRMFLVSGAVMVAGCSSAYYSMWEKLGYEKRDILVSRVQDARDEQQDAKKQFQTTLERFQELTHFDGGDLEAKYKKLSAEYDACEARADAVRKRIQAVDKVATDLFAEWDKELGEYSNADLRHDSEEKLRETKLRYAQLLGIMRRSESKMAPVLSAFKDQVLYLKHNLNAQAIASLKGTAAGIDADVTKLIQDMEASINEANTFINQLKQTK
jgi:hypothetical protein